MMNSYKVMEDHYLGKEERVKKLLNHTLRHHDWSYDRWESTWIDLTNKLYEAIKDEL